MSEKLRDKILGYDRGSFVTEWYSVYNWDQYEISKRNMETLDILHIKVESSDKKLYKEIKQDILLNNLTKVRLYKVGKWRNNIKEEFYIQEP